MNPEKITHSKLIDIGRSWLNSAYSPSLDHGHKPCSIILTEPYASTRYNEIPDIFAVCDLWHGKILTVLIECKVSRSDFYADQKKVCRLMKEGIGGQRWYLAPEGIIPIEKLPEKWGLLEVSKFKELKIIKRPELQERDKDSEMNIIVNLVKRLNILPDDHIGIRKFKPLVGFKPSKKRAEFYIQGEENERNT